MKRFGHDFTALTRSKTTFQDPLKWKEPKRIFVNPWSDFFLEEVPIGWRTDALGIMYDTPQHTYLILTKRPENILQLIPQDSFEFLPNVWLGVSAENQEMADKRIPLLLEVPAQVHFVSAEPLLGQINLAPYFVCGGCGYTSTDKRIQLDHQLCTNSTETVDWAITGGESDFHDPRPMDLAWAKSIRDQCTEAGVAYFHKQHGGTRKIDGAWGARELDGRTWDEYPEKVTDESG